MLKIYGKDFINFDTYIDIEKFLLLKDQFYYFYSSNIDRSTHFWNSAGVSSDVKMFSERNSYYLYHNIMLSNDEVEKDILKSFNDRSKLVRYLQLKYKTFSPYQVLNISKKLNHDIFIPDSIQQWIRSLPFETVDLVSFFFNDHYCPLRYHRDFNYLPIENGNSPSIPKFHNDFIWLRWDLNRQFFLYDVSDDDNILQALPIEGYSAIFNHYNWHGNMSHCEYATLTMKVQGSFKKEFISQL